MSSKESKSIAKPPSFWKIKQSSVKEVKDKNLGAVFVKAIQSEGDSHQPVAFSSQQLLQHPLLSLLLVLWVSSIKPMRSKRGLSVLVKNQTKHTGRILFESFYPGHKVKSDRRMPHHVLPAFHNATNSKYSSVQNKIHVIWHAYLKVCIHP